MIYHLIVWPFSNVGRSCAGVDCTILGETDACSNECRNGKAKGFVVPSILPLQKACKMLQMTLL